MLWQKCKAVGARPSDLIGLEPNSYEAFCLDEAVIYFGLALEFKLEEVGHKPSKEERRTQALREDILNRVFKRKASTSGFADPAAMFQ